VLVGCGGMFETKVQEAQADKRSVQHRSRVMLAATIVTRGFSIDVRIRNLSRSGALIEGDVVPEAGTTVEVLRGSHEVRAEVVWSKPGRCGVKFDQPVVIEQWVGSTGPQPPTPVAFQDADQRPTGPLPAWLAADAPAEGLDERLPKRAGEEIAYVQRLIENIAIDIASNPAIAHRHAGSVQNCRLAGVLLADIARVLLADDRVKAAETVRTKELKARLLRS